jgi:hypothetical protein
MQLPMQLLMQLKTSKLYLIRKRLKLNLLSIIQICGKMQLISLLKTPQRIKRPLKMRVTMHKAISIWLPSKMPKITNWMASWLVHKTLLTKLALPQLMHQAHGCKL